MATGVQMGPARGVKRLLAERIRNKIAERVAHDMDKLLDAQVSIATNDEEGVAATNAFKALIDYAGAKPTDKVEHSGGIGIAMIVKQLEEGDAQTME